VSQPTAEGCWGLEGGGGIGLAVGVRAPLPLGTRSAPLRSPRLPPPVRGVSGWSVGARRHRRSHHAVAEGGVECVCRPELTACPSSLLQVVTKPNTNKAGVAVSARS
jgi:hypothetical protein